MDDALSFFLNAVKTILLLPIYLIGFIFFLFIGLINYIVEEVCSIFCKIRYGSRSINKYQDQIDQKLDFLIKGGVNK